MDKTTLALIVLLMLMALLLTFVMEVEADPGVAVPWKKNCDNLYEGDGFWDRGYCVPGQIISKTHFIKSPSRFHGVGSSYAPGVMEWMCRGGKCKGYKDGIALMSCGDVGRTAWIKVADDRQWYGPLKVVDCSQPFHAYVNIVELGLAVEWGAKTSEVLGMKASSAVRVALGGKPSNGDDRWGWYYRTWWIDYALEWEPFDLNPPLYYIGVRDLALQP